jgi:hypothetical protein
VTNLVDLAFLHSYQYSNQLAMLRSVVSLTMPLDLLSPMRSLWHIAQPSERVDHHVRLEDPGEDVY